MMSFKSAASTLIAVAIGLTAQSAGAVSIDEIDIPITGATYNSISGDFTISGRPASDTAIFYNDGRLPNPDLFDFVIFDLSTIGLDSLVWNGGDKIRYTSSTGVGDISILDGNNGFAPLLMGNLVALNMHIIDPGLGAFEGTGTFNVMGGSLAGDFGVNGGLATIGISFTVPATFNSSFAALANTKLFPDPTASTPEPSAAVLFGFGFIVVAHSLSRDGRRAH